MQLTFFIVFKALVVTLTRIFSPRVSENSRLRCTFGSHVRRVLCFEKGTLFPYCFVLPWKRPSCERLNGCETTENTGKLENICSVRSSLKVTM